MKLQGFCDNHIFKFTFMMMNKFGLLSIES